MTEIKNPANGGVIDTPFAELERAVFTALGTYSNVHRGSGHWSMVTTHLYEQAREIVLEYLGLDNSSHTVVFCNPEGVWRLIELLAPGCFQILSSQDLGLPLGVRAIAVPKNKLPKGAPFHPGGGTARLVGKDWILWAGIPDRFEAGTPAIINVITFAKALRMTGTAGKDIFRSSSPVERTPAEILFRDSLEHYSGMELLEKLRETLIGRGMPVPTQSGDQPFINFDNSASTPSFLPVWDAARYTWRLPAETQQEVIRETKSIISGFLDAPAATYDVTFTSNTTGAVNLVAQRLSRRRESGHEPVILSSILEHSSNDLPWRLVPHHTMERLTMDSEGFLDLAKLEDTMNSYNREGRYGNKRITLVALTGASNVLGSVNDINRISRIVHNYGARFLVDAAQLVAHRAISMEEAGIDYLAFSAHKIYAPFGTGVLVAKKGLLGFDAREMEMIRASGEENVTGIAALGKALVLLQRAGMDVIREKEQSITAGAMNGLSKIKGMTIFGVRDASSPKFPDKIGVIAFNMKAGMAHVVARELASRGGIGIRSGCHCAHILVKQLAKLPPKLERIQKFIVILFPGLTLPGVARVSFGIGNTPEEVDRLVRVLEDIAEKRSAGERAAGVLISKGEVKKRIDDFVQDATKRVYS